MNLPINYVVEVIYSNCRRISHRNHRTYNFECPICREGKSLGKKRRGFYFSDNDYIYCQNCQKSWNPVNWIMEVCDMSFREVMQEASGHDNTFNEVISKQYDPPKEDKKTYTLPYDSINLSDPVQLEYYKNDKTVQHCLKYIKTRRLNRAINHPNTFYVSLTDRIHKNRLCIPFYDLNGKIIYYQTRAMYEKDADIAKYLSKVNADKSLYGIDKVKPELSYIFIFEGPIDSMFCENGVAACGLTLTPLQREQLNKYCLFEHIWVLDNQLGNEDVREKYEKLIDDGETVFFWPKEFSNYKDVNEICMTLGKNHLPHKLFLNNSYSGLKAKLRLKDLT